MIKKFELQKGNTIPADSCTNWIITKSTEKRVTIGLIGNMQRTFVFQWDGKGYKRQNQYLYKDGIR